ncbi:hypothetical protein ACFSJ3_08295 [Corallincola platygyrae]|uniref:SGNH/GDSL hydrolase family protein n=1 Tax=Corallincola platygyrae TaxID=1193278 RepID=A0ABW4XME2_9GAMM
MFRFWQRLSLDAPLLKRVLLVWIGLELCVAFILPSVLPTRWYFDLYLPDKAVESTHKFLAGEGYLKPDVNVGWVNQSNLHEHHWQTDQFGARTTATYAMERNGRGRVLFAGSSMINGGHLASNAETISGFLASNELETMNFGTMLHEMDQVLIYYRHYLKQFQPDLLVVGINPDPVSGLKNLYIPLRRPKEVYMPYLKPRFEYKLGVLALLSVDPQWLSPLPNQQLLHILGEHDAYYGRFERYQRTHFMPLSRSVDYLRKQFSRVSKLWQGSDENAEHLLELLMQLLINEAAAAGTKVVFLAMPDAAQFRGGWKQKLHDDYGDRLARLKKRYPVIDVRKLFRESGWRQKQLFQADRVHYQPAANELIADALRQSDLSCHILHSCQQQAVRQ